MKAAQWRVYELIDTSDGERLERWGNIILIRPDPEIIWKTEKKNPLWRNAHARYHRSKTGGGAWENYKPVPDVWKIRYNDELTFRLKPMGFKHTGLFPEQAVNWEFAMNKIRNGLHGRGRYRVPRGCFQGHCAVGQRKRGGLRAF